MPTDGSIGEQWHAQWSWRWTSRQISRVRPSELLNTCTHSIRFVEFAMHRVRMLIHFGVTPYIVFDGDYLPNKAATENERAKKRADSKRLGQELQRVGKISQAYLEFQKAIDVTPEMARQLIEELKRHNIKYVVAPYEADAQLAYLERKGIIHGALSEDSDLLVFGVKRLLTKLDQYGECIEINRKDFTACKDISLVGWTDADFRRMAILSGCDYLQNINKMGLKTAYRLLRKHKTIERILRMLSFDGVYKVPPGYLEDFRKAELTFLHQRVYCPIQRRLLHLTPLEGPEPDDFDFVGKDVEATTATGIATGDLNPMTKEQIIYYPALRPANSPSPWSLNRRKTVDTLVELKPQKPIEEFFKPKRVPLAELDPNSFTPSPSQQRVLELQSGSIGSTPIEAIGSSLRSAIANQGRNGSASASTRVHSITNIQHPPKRQRLCAEDDSDGSNKCSPGAKQSRFFGTTAFDPSPSLNSRSQRNRHASVSLWSDDSVEDAMVKLPDVSDGVQKSDKSMILQEPSIEHRGAPTKDPATAESTASIVTPLSTDSTNTSNPETPPSPVPSVSTDDADDCQALQSSQRAPKKLTSGFLELSKRYSLATPNREQSPGPSKTSADTMKSLRRPVQRTISRLPQSSSYLPSTLIHSASDTQISYPQLPPTSTDSVTSPASKPLISTLEVARSPEARSKQAPLRGSEDCLVPCSEAESEGEENVPDGFTSKGLNLGRFAFVS